MWRKIVIVLAALCSTRPLFCDAQALRSSRVEASDARLVDATLTERELMFGKRKEDPPPESEAKDEDKDEEAVVEVIKEKVKADKATKKGAMNGKKGGGKKKKSEEEMTDEELKEELEEELEEEVAEGEVVVFNEDGDEIVEAPKHAAPVKKLAPENIRDQNRNIPNLMASFQMAKAQLLDGIKKDYGEELFETVFMDTPAMDMPLNQTRCTIGRNAFILGAPKTEKAWTKTVRKMKINLLQYLLGGEVEDFVWATAGNSDAAGHGNFFGEQYTMVMRDRAAHMFESVGLNLVTRPFAMGRATSAPEIAACAEEIFGTDVDMITWDFSMTDGRWYWRMEFFAHRVNRLPNHPVLLVLQAGTDGLRQDIVRYMITQGVKVMRQDEKYVMDKKLLFPDSRFRTPDELEQMPDLVRNFRCGYGIETGPGCSEDKFTKNGTCDERPHMVNWHHGRKWHAFHGTLYALFLMEVMEDALSELQAEAGNDLRSLYEAIMEEEVKKVSFFEDYGKLRYKSKWQLNDDTASKLYRDPAYCHTALLPAQARYLGHLLNHDTYDDWFHYAKGTPLTQGRLNPSSKIVLSYIPKPRTDKCEVPTNIDSEDFFLTVSRAKRFQKITIPNNREIEAYGLHSTSGVIMLCVQVCSFACSNSPLINPSGIKQGFVKLKVNGEDVASIRPLDNCFVLQRANGDLHWPTTERYEIEVKVDRPGKQFRITSFVVW